MTRPFIAVFVALFLAAFVPAGETRAQGGTWTTVAPMMLDRSGAAGEVIDGKFYVVSGSSAMEPPTTPTFEMYDPGFDRWTLGTSRPLSLAHARAEVINRTLYVVGGCVNADCGTMPTKILQKYDPATNRWTPGSDMPTIRHLVAVGVIDGKLYVAGGHDRSFGALSTLEAYDPDADTWTTLSPMSTGRAGAAGGVINGIFYVAGGSQKVGRVDVYLDTAEAYDPRTNTWTARAPMPTPRYNGASGVIDGVLYAMGGTDGATLLETVVAYDPATNEWTTVAPIPTPRYGLVAGVVNGTLYAAGGVGVLHEGKPLTTVEAYTPPISPCQAIRQLITTVSAAHIFVGVATSLNAKLAAAAASCDRGQTNATVSQLRAFQNEVRAQSGKAIPPATADAFIGAAQRIIDALEGAR